MFVNVELLRDPAEPADLMKKPSVKINLSKHASVDHTEQLYTRRTVIAIHKHMSAIPLTLPHTHTHTHSDTHTHLICLLLNPKQPLRSFPFALLSCVGGSRKKKKKTKKTPALPYVGKQMPQHSMQISRQSEDSQQASMMPQSMSHGQLQSSPRSSVQQQQQQASDVHAPQEACATTMLQSVRNSQNRQAKMQWTQQSGVAQT